MLSKEKDDMYKIQIRNHIIFSLKKPAYLYSDTPVQLLIDNGIFDSYNDHRLKRIASKEANLNSFHDTGIDIIQVESDGSLTLVQCKNGHKGVTIEDLADILDYSLHFDKLNAHVYYTDKISDNLESLNSRLSFIKQPFIDPTTVMMAPTTEMKPHQYQLDVVQNMKENLGNRCILSMPCGTGKTFVSYLFVSYLLTEGRKQIIILSPLKQHAKQSLDKFIEYGYAKEKTLLVDSDGERDIEKIKLFMEKNDSFLMSATFWSVDVIRKVLSFMDNPYIIVDEFHNLSKTNVIDESDDFCNVLNSEQDILFMSATPRVYEIEEEDIDRVESAMSDDFNQRVFGPIIDSMSFREAIENKYVSDYEIYLPSISSQDEQLNKELSIYDIDSKLKDKGNFLLLSLSKTGSKKCIVYCADTQEIADFTEALNTLNKFHQLEYDVSQITSFDKDTSRKEILNKFSNSNTRQLLLSVRILDEGIDIPLCDSIFIMYPSNSKIRTIQRINRCTRINSADPFKIGRLFLWCDDYNQMTRTLDELKEYDPSFNHRISVSDLDYYGETYNKELLEKDKVVLDDLMYKVDTRAYIPKEWSERASELRDYIILHKRKPSVTSIDPYIRSLGVWTSDQQYNYDSERRNMKIGAKMRDDWSEIKNEFEDLFLSSDEKFNRKIGELRNFVLEHKRSPSASSSDDQVRSLGKWRSDQRRNYKYEKNNMKIGSTNREDWMDFIKEFEVYLLYDVPKWESLSTEVENYILANKKSPSSKSIDPDIRFLGVWVKDQQRSFKNRTYIMKNDMIRDKW
eukprot:CAMPEP_0119045650 /NCGR_PEP_ID=MMETSP1177-20130426/41670_1 /TAXON_ID=2985 /ORGANISM="Ochromonas sp, Strain CCMP1899" /LENGTH=794 /DNA_ID=CAMNT_0007017797 /DNA_START=468 /DNA_END=2849 /DNA_ORIENTATION=-